MPSPFPGMDPYLESHWGDIHHRLITYGSDQLQSVLPFGLVASIEERVVLETAEGPEGVRVPDVRVIETRRVKPKKTAAANGPAVAEPLVLKIGEQVTQGYIEIRDARSGMRVITVIEVLSPSNKLPGDGQDKYLKKRRELRDGRVSLVEIDLVRTGKRLLPVFPSDLPEDYRTPYLIWARRGWEVEAVEVYRVPLTERLPIIKIPLRQSETDALLDLQPLIEQCYRNGRYEDRIDYRTDPEPPLEGEDARWVEDLLRQAGLRGRRRRRSQS
jgi:Protein of unknown function (DUF4058)